MPAKTAKRTFTKDEIIDILKQNVVLFKDEPEFVDYIVNLALFLIDQAYCVNGERAAELDAVLNHISKTHVKKQSFSPKAEEVDDTKTSEKHPKQERPATQLPRMEEVLKNQSRDSSLTNLIEQENQSVDESDAYESDLDSNFNAEEEAKLSTPELDQLVAAAAKKRKSLQDTSFEPLMKSPPSSEKDKDKDNESEFDYPSGSIPEGLVKGDNKPADQEPEYHEPKTDKLGKDEIEEIKRQTREESLEITEENRPLLDVPIKKYKSPGEVTPIPKGGITGNKSINPDDLQEDDPPTRQIGGRVSVNKVVRSYKDKRESDRCPACNAYTRGRSICPSCGQIL